VFEKGCFALVMLLECEVHISESQRVLRWKTCVEWTMRWQNEDTHLVGFLEDVCVESRTKSSVENEGSYKMSLNDW
jgi:hypothetical protein